MAETEAFGKKCVCGGQMQFETYIQLPVMKQHIFDPDRFYGAEIYVCGDCGRIDLFQKDFRPDSMQSFDKEEAEWFKTYSGFSDDKLLWEMSNGRVEGGRNLALWEVMSARGLITPEEETGADSRKDEGEAHIPFGRRRKEKDPWDE